MLSWLTALFIINSASAYGAPAKLAILAGASGESDGKNFFIDDLKGFQTGLTRRGWKVQAAVGDKPGLLPSSKKAQNAEILSMVKGTLGKAAKGDQVLLVIHDHGYPSERAWGQRSHSIVTEDQDSSGAELGFDLDSLEGLMTQASARGARLALVDLSCYSGTTLRLKGPSCTLTLAAPRYISLCSGRPEEQRFGARFFQLPAVGQAADLATQFLEARRADQDSVNLPQLSSRPAPAIAGWDAFLAGVDPLDTYEDLKELRPGAKPFDASVLMAEIDQAIMKLPAETRRAPATGALRRKIVDKLSKILETRLELERELPELLHDLDEPELESPKTLTAEPIRISVSALNGALEAIREKAGPKTPGFTQAKRNLLARMASEKDAWTAAYLKEITEFQQRRKSFDALTDQLEAETDELFTLERAFYELQPAPEKDPCKEFGL